MKNPKHCSAVELLGALLIDGVRPEAAERIADGYEHALNEYDNDEIEAWLAALRTKIPSGHTWLYTIAMGTARPMQDPAYLRGMSHLAAKDAKSRLAQGEVA